MPDPPSGSCGETRAAATQAADGRGVGLDLAPPSEPRGAAVCPACLGYGYLRLDKPVGHAQFGQMEPCQTCGTVLRHRISVFERFSSRQERALGQFFRNFALDGPASAASDAFNEAVAFAAEPRGWLVIHGPKGNGKSHLAAAIANHLIETCHVPTLFLTAPDLLEALRREVRGSAQGWPQEQSTLLDAARAAPVLILDDLGAEYLTAWAVERLFLLLDHRYRTNAPTVVITNEELESLPPRIYSRLGDRTLSKVVHNPAADYRWGHGRVTR